MIARVVHSYVGLFVIYTIVITVLRRGGGHFVYNIMTQERNSSCQVIGAANKMPLPMTEACIKILNIGAEQEKTDAPDGVVFADGYGKATIHDYVEDDA